MMKSIMVIGAVVLLSAPVAMAKERSFGACASDIKAKCVETFLTRGGGSLKTAVTKHTQQNFPTRVRRGLHGSPGETSKACTTDVKESCPGKERSCILKSIGNVKDQCKEALGQSVAGTK